MVIADERLAGTESQEISNGTVAILVKQAVEFPFVHFLHD